MARNSQNIAQFRTLSRELHSKYNLKNSSANVDLQENSVLIKEIALSCVNTGNLICFPIPWCVYSPEIEPSNLPKI